MPRSRPSLADEALLAALAERGPTVSPYQLERWRAMGMLPRNRRRGLGRGRGSTSEYDEQTLRQASMLARFAGQGRQIPSSSVIERFAAGVDMPELRIRLAYVVELDRIGRKIRADAPPDDDGWRLRRQAAARVARKAIVYN